MKRCKTGLLAGACCLLTLAAVFALFRALYLYDNKYTQPVYGGAGVCAFTEADLEQPLFLVDGWLLSVDGGPEQETFLGQFSNFSYVTGGSPFGRGTYRLTLQCPGTRALTLELPEIFTDYTLYLDGTPIASTGSGTSVGFVLADRAELRLEVENRTHYYSGLTYPPALGTPAAVSALISQRLMFYVALVVCALTLAAFSGVLWISRSGDRLFLHFGVLCLAFVLSCLHPFLWHLGWSGPFWYAMEDAARILMLVQAVEIAGLLAHWSDLRLYRLVVRPLGWVLCGLVFCSVWLIIPNFGSYINLYGHFVDGVSVLGWTVLCLCAAAALRRGAVGSVFLASGCCALGAGFLVNLLNNNRFEPICTGWQGEWAGFLLVLLFGGLMVRHNRDILLQNRRLVAHMEELVQERTRELHTVLDERKRFFDHMAHNLKAPITAVHGFISLIREGNLYLDDELRSYIHLIEEENEEIGRRVQSLSALRAFDRVTAPRVALDVDALLGEVYAQNAPEAEAAGVHLTAARLNRPATVLAQREKLLTVFENLIYNALAFTPPDGSISITPRLEGGDVVMDVADTGAGIAPEHLSHIFEQFYTTRPESGGGSGLGLYIVKLTVEELGGAVTASSSPGSGSVFSLRIPLYIDEGRQG